jgi:hypothetical protein
VLPWFEARKKELANRPIIREQAFGQSLDPDKLERLSRYEVHLDRKVERTLAMMLRLKGPRQGRLIRFAKPRFNCRLRRLKRPRRSLAPLRRMRALLEGVPPPPVLDLPDAEERSE